MSLEVFQRFRRWEVKLWLGLVASIACILPTSSYAIQAAASVGGGAPVDTSTIIYAAIGLLGGVVTLLGSVVMAVRGVIKHRAPEVRNSDTFVRVAKMLEEQERQRQREFDSMRRDFERMETRLEERIDRLRISPLKP